MARKLYYFDMKGYAEGVRYILHYGGLEFEDVRLKKEEYPKFKEGGVAPFGKVPVYIEGDRTLNQSLAIARYIGRQLDLIPTDPWEEASLDAVIHTFSDLYPNLRAYISEEDPTKKETLKQKTTEEVDYYFSRFDKQLADNNGIFGKKLSWADIVFVAMLETLRDHTEVNIENYKNIKTLVTKIQNFPGIKAYLDKSNG